MFGIRNQRLHQLSLSTVTIMFGKKRSKSCNDLPTTMGVRKNQKTSALKKLLRDLPLELREMILNRVALPQKIDFVDLEDSDCLNRIQRSFRANDIIPRLGRDTNWGFELKSFVSSLPSVLSYNTPCYSRMAEIDQHSGIQLTGLKMEHAQYSSSTRSHLKFIMKVAKGTEGDGSKKTMILDHKVERKKIIGRYSKNDYCEFYIGNNYDLAVNHGKGVKYYSTKMDIGRVLKIAIDENDIMYNGAMQQGGIMNFYRKHLASHGDFELFYTTRPRMMIDNLAVANDKLFFGARNYGINSTSAFCYDMNTKKEYTMVCQDLDLCSIMIAHGDSVLVTKDNMGTSRNTEFVMLSLENDEIVRRNLNLSYRRLQQLNRDTYLILVDEGPARFSLKTFSIIEGQPIVRFVQYCHEESIFRRIGDQFFFVLEPRKRNIWYQETPGGKRVCNG
uniref:F-box domain-containing protein n=1 Tax=Bursaphelenchus xylophilus TaxID=6326 RepID=A0A1I7S4W3_BURXY